MTGVGNLLWRLGKVSGVFVALVYAAFSLSDMIFSMTAFLQGVPEANPVMVWLLHHGLFVPGKIALTAFVAVLIGWSYRMEAVRPAAWGALLVTFCVNVYHVWGLSVV